MLNPYAFIPSFNKPIIPPSYYYNSRNKFTFKTTWIPYFNEYTNKNMKCAIHINSLRRMPPQEEHQNPSSPLTTTRPISFTYQLGTSLYIPLTSKCNSKTLPQTRGGKKFLKTLPKDVLRSLMLVRLMERGLMEDHHYRHHQQKQHQQEHSKILWNQFISLMTIMSNQQGWNKIFSSESTLFNFIIMKKDIDRIIETWLVKEEEEQDTSQDDNNVDDYYNDKEMIHQIHNVITSFVKINLDENDYTCILGQDMQLQLEDNVENNNEYHTTSNPSSSNNPIFDILLFNEIQSTLLQNNNHHYQHPHQEELPPPPIKSIVFAGEGEPLLQLEKIISLSKLIKKLLNYNITIRVLTNGLLYYHYYTPTPTTISKYHSQQQQQQQQVKLLQKMKDSGVDSLTIAFPTSCSEQYIQLMKPSTKQNNYTDNITHDGDYKNDFTFSAHKSVCQFIKNSLKVGFDVEVTGVVQEYVNQKETESMAISLGVHQPFRWRTFVI